MCADHTPGYLPKNLSLTNENKAPYWAIIIPGIIGFLLSLTQYGALFSLVSDKFFGKYPARDNAKIWRE
jgi:amino acid transporter